MQRAEEKLRGAPTMLLTGLAKPIGTFRALMERPERSRRLGPILAAQSSLQAR